MPDSLACVVINPSIDECRQVRSAPPHAERAITGVDEIDGSTDDRARRGVQISSEVTTCMASTKPSSRSRSSTTSAMRSWTSASNSRNRSCHNVARSGWVAPARSAGPFTAPRRHCRRFRDTHRVGRSVVPSLDAKTAACVRRSIPNLASKRET
jgi:hypothetical protein